MIYVPDIYAHGDLSLCWVHRLFIWLCEAGSHKFFFIFLSVNLKQMVKLFKKTVSISLLDDSFEYPQHMSWLKNNFQLHTVFTSTTVNESNNLSLLAQLLCFLCLPFVAIVRENYCLPRFHGKHSEILSQSHALPYLL